MSLSIDDVLSRIEKAMDWTFLYKPPPFERRLQDIEAEIARLRGIPQKDRVKESKRVVTK